MIIEAKSIMITLMIVLAAGVYGLKFIRQFALQIAQENHDAVVAMDQEEEQQRLKKEKAADAAAAAAFAKVEPILKVKDNSKTASTTTATKPQSASTASPASRQADV